MQTFLCVDPVLAAKANNVLHPRYNGCMGAPRTTDEWATTLGEQVRNLRLNHDLTQAEVAERASISRPALQALETGQGSSVATLIKVLRALDALHWLQTLSPISSEPTPMELLRLERAKPAARSRVSRAGQL